MYIECSDPSFAATGLDCLQYSPGRIIKSQNSLLLNRLLLPVKFTPCLNLFCLLVDEANCSTDLFKFRKSTVRAQLGRIAPTEKNWATNLIYSNLSISLSLAVGTTWAHGVWASRGWTCNVSSRWWPGHMIPRVLLFIVLIALPGPNEWSKVKSAGSGLQRASVLRASWAHPGSRTWACTDTTQLFNSSTYTCMLFPSVCSRVQE